MGNPQHLEWLLEGVEAWNARREADDFEPDLSGLKIRQAFEAARKLTDDGRIPLEGANLGRANLGRADLVGADLGRADLRRADLKEASLGEADLREADLKEAYLGGANLLGADLEGADLVGADLEGAYLVGASLGGANLREVDLREAHLGEADLRGAYLRRADLKEADLTGATVRTSIYSGAGTNDEIAPEYTDLSTSLRLAQSQVDVMDGDTGTLLPEGLTHPPHWPDPIKVEEERSEPGEPDPMFRDDAEPVAEPTSTRAAEDDSPSAVQLSSSSLIQQASFLIATAPAATESARFAAHQIEEAVNRFHNETGANSSDEGELLLAVANSFVVLGTAIESASADQSEVEALKATIAAQQAEIERLTGLLANATTARQQVIVGALGAAGGVALTSGAGYIFGPEGQQIITNLIDLIRGGGGTPPSLPPTIGT